MVASIAAVVGKAVDFCANKHPTYEHRVNDPGEYNWCTVEGKSWDVILFAGIAVVVACLSQGPYSSLIVLMAGGGLMGFVYPFNLREIGNGVALWLGIEPYELFFYIFLPPLLLDAALKIDWYVFKKVGLNVVTLAFLVVMGMCGVLIPVMLYVFWLKPQGWAWYDAALFGSMIASTDAVAIVAVLKKSGGPERLRILLEGESLLNDASSITLFTIFIEFVIEAAEGHPNHQGAGAIIATIIKKMLWLAVGGGLVGFGFGICTRGILRGLQRFGASAEQQIALTLACGYLSFYVANAPCKVSGVIAVAVFGLYGAATSKFDISAKLEESGAFDDFWDTFAFVANGIVFFYAGASSINFVIRSADSLGTIDKNDLFSSLWRAPLVWLMLNVLRFLIIVAFKPLFWVGKAPLTLRDCLFCAGSGLRGSVSLILAQAVVTEVPQSVDPVVQKVQSEVVMFTAIFVMLTLLVNAPMLPRILRWTKLDAVPLQHQKMRRKALRMLLRHTDAAIDELRDDDDEMLRGVDWDAVHKYVDVSAKLDSFVNPHDRRPVRKPWVVPAWVAAACCCWRRRNHRGTTRPAHRVPPRPHWSPGDDEEVGTSGGNAKGDEDGMSGDGTETTSDAQDSAYRVKSPHRMSLDAGRSSEEDRGDPFIAEIDEYGLEGELPFLPRNSVAGDINFGADLNTSASDLLPTHYGPPLKRTSIGAGTAGSAADLRRASTTPVGSPLVTDGAAGFAARLRGRHSMAHALRASTSELQPGIIYSGDGIVTEGEDEGPRSGLGGLNSRSTPALAPPPTTQQAQPKSPLGRASASMSNMRGAGRPTETAALAALQSGPATRSSMDGGVPQKLKTASALLSPEATIKRQPAEARRSLADLFGGDGLTGVRKAPAPSRPSLASLFPAAEPEEASPTAAPSGNVGQGGAALRSTSADMDGAAPRVVSSFQAAQGLAKASPRQLPGASVAGEAARNLPPTMGDANGPSAGSEGDGPAPKRESPHSQLTGAYAALTHPHEHGVGTAPVGQPVLLPETSGISKSKPQGVGEVDEWGDHPSIGRGGFAQLLAGASEEEQSASENERSVSSLSKLAGRALSAALGRGTAAGEGASGSLGRSRSATRPSLKGLFGGQGEGATPSPRGASPRRGLATGVDRKQAVLDADAAPEKRSPSLNLPRDYGIKRGYQPKGDEDAEAGANEPSDQDRSRHRDAVQNGGQHTSRDYICDAPVQRHAFRAKRTNALAARTAAEELNTAAPAIFGPAVLGSSDNEGTWSSLNAQTDGARSQSLSKTRSAENLQAQDSVSGLLNPSNKSNQHTWHTGVLPKRTAVLSGGTVNSVSDSLNGDTYNSAGDSDALQGPQPEAEEVADMRARICAGMKRYFHTKSIEGLLSNRGLRILDHCCDTEIDDPHTPLALWQGLESEITGGWLRSLLVRAVFRLRRYGIKLKRSKWRMLRWGLGVPGYYIVDLGQRLLSKQLLLSCEVAMEYLLALTHSPQVHWLWEHEGSRVLMREVEAESKRVWKFIIDREIEAPERFRAIQSYRAAMAVLRQQMVFIERMAHSGMVTQQESQMMSEPVDTARRKLAHRGPVWRAPLVIDVLRSMPIMRDLPAKVLNQVLAQGHLLMYPKGRQIHESAPDEGIFIVCSGLVCVRYNVLGTPGQKYFLGTGGMFGPFSALTGESLAGRAVAIAEGNALGKGPVVFELPPAGIANIRDRAAAGDPSFMQLEVDLFRMAALYVVERLGPQLLDHIRTVLHAARRAQERRVGADGEEDDPRNSRAALRLRSLFDAGTANDAAAAAPPVGGAPRRPNLGRRSSWVGTLDQPQPRKTSGGGLNGQSAAWLLEQANGEDTLGRPAHTETAQDTMARDKAERAARCAAAKRHIDRQAEAVAAGLRAQLSGAEVVELPPGARLPHSCSVVLLRGGLHLSTATPAAVCTEAPFGRHSTIHEHEQLESQHQAPAILPWVWDVPIDAPGGRNSIGAEPVDAGKQRFEVSQEGEMVAGEKGATLVIASDNDQQLDELLHLIPPPPSPDARGPNWAEADPQPAGGSSRGDTAGASLARGVASVTSIVSALSRAPRAGVYIARAAVGSTSGRGVAPTIEAPAPADGRQDGGTSSGSEGRASGTQDSAHSFLRPNSGRSDGRATTPPQGATSPPAVPVAGGVSASAASDQPTAVRSPFSAVRDAAGAAAGAAGGDDAQERSPGAPPCRPTLARRSTRRLLIAGTGGELRAPRSLATIKANQGTNRGSVGGRPSGDGSSGAAQGRG